MAGKNDLILKLYDKARQIISKTLTDLTEKYKVENDFKKRTLLDNEILLTTSLDIPNNASINIEYFINSLLILTDDLIDSDEYKIKYTEFEPNYKVEYKKDTRDINTPLITHIIKVYNEIFNCNILVINVNDRTFKINSKTVSNSIEQNQLTDKIVIIRKGGSHFQVLILPNSKIEDRANLYIDALDNINVPIQDIGLY
jgi:hypothetical protein